MLEVGYIERGSLKKKILVVAVAFLILMIPVRAFGGIDLGPMIAVLKEILSVSRTINDGINTISELQRNTIGKIQEVKNTLYSYTRIPVELHRNIMDTVRKVEQIKKNTEMVFSKDFWKDYGYGGGLNRVVRYLDSVKVDKDGKVVNANGQPVNDETVKAYATAMTNLVPDYKKYLDKIPNKTPEIDTAINVVKVQKTELQSAVVNSVIAEKTVANYQIENENLYRDISGGVDAGVLAQKTALLIAINNNLLIQLNQQLAQLNKIQSIQASYLVSNREKAIEDYLKSIAGLENRKKQ